MLKWILRTILYFLVAETLKGHERGRTSPPGDRLGQSPPRPAAPARTRRGPAIDPRDVIEADFRPAPAGRRRPSRPGDAPFGSKAPGAR